MAQHVTRAFIGDPSVGQIEYEFPDALIRADPRIAIYALVIENAVHERRCPCPPVVSADRCEVGGVVRFFSQTRCWCTASRR